MGTKNALSGVLVTVLLLGGIEAFAEEGGGRKTYRLDEVPAAWRPSVEKAERAIGDLQKNLVTKLTSTLEQGGPIAAIEVCSHEAEGLAEKVSKEHAVELGRTSHKLRNPRNAPRAWVEPFLKDANEKKAAAFEPVVVDLGNKIGMLKPIGTAGFCLTCHGASIDETVRRKILEKYPADKATGFSEGDLRGVIWAEIPLPKP